MNEWNNSQTGELIELWREKGILYDSKLKAYFDREKRQTAIAEIKSGLSFVRTENAIKAKMKSLRTQYLRIRSDSKKKPSGSGAEEVIKWPYFESLSFLEPYVKPRPSNTNYKDVSSPEVPETQGILSERNNEEDEVDDMDSTFNTQIMTKRKGEPENSDRKTKKQRQEDFENLVIKKSLSCLESIAESCDEFEVFGKHVAHELRKMDPQAVGLAKLQIQQVIFNLQSGRHWPNEGHQSSNYSNNANIYTTLT